MEAVILAAGTGSRLRPITISQPKGCVSVDGKPILTHQLEAYDHVGVEEVHVVTGYMASKVEAVCERFTEQADLTVTAVENKAFANTNNLYSLHQVRDAVEGEPFLLSNGDVVFDSQALEAVCAPETGSHIACEVGRYDDEAMKVTVDGGGQLTGISKEIDPGDAHATSIDVYRFSETFSEVLFDKVTHLVEVENRYGCWTEVAIDAVLGRGNRDTRPADIGESRWIEIDDRRDLLRADRTFSSVGDLREKDAILFDLDGTVYVGDRLVDGADTTVEALRDAGVDVYFLTNNSSQWKPDYADRLTRLGIPTAPEDVIVSTDGVIEYLLREDIDETFVVGTDAMRTAIADRDISPDSSSPDAVVVGFDTELTYEKVREATLALRDGAEYLLAHQDLVCPTREGLVPDCGSIGALVSTAAGREPDRVFGKPATDMIAHLLEDPGISREGLAIVGDRLETEIRLAEQVGCDSICVLSGETTRSEIEETDLTPSLIVDDVGDLV